MMFISRRIFFTNVPGWECDNFEDLPKLRAELGFIDENEPEPKQDITQSSEEVQNVAIPIIIEYSNIRFFLSRELLKGMEGGRDKYHKIQLSVLESCLFKTSKKLKKIVQDKKVRFEYYFKQKDALSENSYNLLRLIIDSYPPLSGKEEEQKSFTVITCFYVFSQDIKRTLRYNDEAFSQWLKNVVEVK